jgi:NADH-quinone oxidoreductase subunit A
MSAYNSVLVYLAVIVGFALITLLLAALIRARKAAPGKTETYECGEEVLQKEPGRFHVGYYLVALIFVVFDVEVIFLFPWAVYSKQLGLLGLVEIIIFVGILFLGWIYAYRKKNLEWQ